MEKVAISETVITNQEQNDDNEVKKIEFNVNAEEFVPVLCLESPLNGSEALVDEGRGEKPTVINKKLGEDYKPVFMDGMTEKFIEGPHVGNGKDPEIPFVRYFSKAQTLDFFNKKYFSPDHSGEILYRPHDASEGSQDDYQQRPFLENLFIQSNIFRPPIIDLLVQDILYRQQLASNRPNGVPPGVVPPPRRGGGKPTSYPGRTITRKEPFQNGSQEDWAEKGKEARLPNATSTPNGSPVKEIVTKNPTETIQNDESLEETELEEIQLEAPLEQRPHRARGKMNLILSTENVKIINGQRVPEERNPAKEDISIGTKESNDNCDSLQESENLRSMEGLSLEVNITIDSPNREYSIKEEAELINL